MAVELSVVIMAFNEEGGVRDTVDRAIAALTAEAVQFEILIVDDGSTDATPAIADELAKDARVEVVHHRPNQGLGAVYRTGFTRTRGRWVGFLPADGEIPAEAVLHLYRHRADADLVLGALPDDRRPLLARALSAAERALIRAAFGHFPRFQGGLLVSANTLERVPVAMAGSRGWMLVTELIVRAHRAGLRIVSTGTGYVPRSAGRSKVRNLNTVLANLGQLGLLRLVLWGLGPSAKPLRPPSARPN